MIRAVALVSSGEKTDTAAYNMAIAGCRHVGRPVQALSLYERMREAGVPADRQTYEHALVCAMRLRRHAQALAVWEQLCADPHVVPGRVEYTAAISACERSGEYGRALALFDAMQAKGVVPDSNAMHVAVLAANQIRQPARASEMLSRIELLGARPPTELYNGAMLACAATEQWTLAAELFTRMHRLGVPRDAASYSAVIWACHVGTGAHEGARTKLLLAVDHLLQEPAERPQLRWYVRTLEACARHAKWQIALDVMGGAVAGEERVSTARANGVSDVPGIRRPVWHTAAYNEAIAACVRDGQHADALALFDRMRSASPAERVEPDRTTLSLAARALAIEGKRDESYQLLREIRSRGEEPDRTALLALLSACADASSWDMALRVLEETSTALNRPPTAAAATTAATATTAAASMGAVAGAGMGDAAAKVETATAAAAALASVQHGSSGSGELRALAMRACNNAGRWQYALRLFDAVRRTGAVPGATEWQEAMHSFAAGGLGQRAAVGLNVMARAGIGGVTFGVIESNVALSAAARSGRLSEAVQLLVEMADPDVGSYDAVLARLVSTARHQDALALFERMLASGLSPLEHHYRIAIGACASIAQGGRAAELLLDMQARGMVFSAAAADAMHACNAAGMPEVALDIFEAIRFEAATPNSAAATSAANSVHVFNAALDALRRQSEPSAAVDLLLSMHSKHSAEPLGSSYAIALSACRRSGRLDMLPRVLQAAVEHSERRPGWLCTDELHSELLVQARVPLSAALYNALLPALERCAGAGVLGLSTLGTALGTGRGRSAVVSARMRDPHERRIDAADGKPYSRDEFADFYGDDADLMWAAAARITSSVGAHGGAPTGAAAPGSVAAEAAAAPALRVVEHGLAMGAFGETLSLAGELLEINLSPFTTPAALRAAVHYWAHALRAQLDALDGDVALTDVVFLAGASADSSAEEASSVRTASRVALSLRLFSPLQLGKSEDHTGHIHLLYSRDNKEVFVTRSTDGGESWGASTNLTASLKLELDPESIFVATGPPGGVQLASGRLVGGFYYNGLNGTRSAAIFSDDHGATWRRGAEVFVSQTPLPNASSVVYMGGECQVTSYAPAGPQGLVMLMRVRGDFPTNAVDHNHATAISRDGGETWTVASLIHATSSYCEGSIATVGKSVLISAPSTTNGGRANLTVWAARPVGESLDAQYSLTVYPGASAYSSMLAGKRGGTVLNLFERDNDPYVPKNLTLATFDVPALR
ncbi:glycosyl hydrolase bnr repeat-containing protein [Chrysochromulina tobinii]|uniref:Glycosyl hydrolase bnr repeat-containing protein n=1 Tax=Chrysochromulina tobinii TaxID=1460289 RepID=A0A0M0JVA4_9EUKA|nr:glycosyl hydrolase bnr repeat-containing protein [Chrysochromulina tobinii]|eukprot:KOO30282.1 glycosyl hydrolase bnr repeat-containing protein [Chrysochromulina sp. CCMP291]